VTKSQILCERLAREFPGISVLLREHRSDHDGLLPHVFFGDLTRYVLADGKDKVAIVQRLEDAMSQGGPDVEELICVSFVENIETRQDLDRAVAGVRGNKIREEWDRQRAE
jgi:hypothetical protein